jgi:hypothetical protein
LLRWFHEYSDTSVFLIVFTVVVLPIVVAPYAIRRITGWGQHPGLSNGAWEAVKLLSSFAGAVIAFSLVQVHGNLRSASDLVSREASALTESDRLMHRLGTAQSEQSRVLLQTYVRSVIKDDWPSMQVTHAQGNHTTDAAFTAVLLSIRKITPENAHQQVVLDRLLNALEKSFDAREDRLSASEWQLPSLFWWAIVALMTLLLGLVALMECSAERTVSVTGIAAGLALMLALLIIIDGPFDGETSVQPSAIERSLGDMVARI